jgi:hypothetical protein
LLINNIAQGGVLPNIRTELLPKKTKGNEENTGNMESQRGAQNHPAMMIQSAGSMTSNGMKKKSMPPVKKSLAPSISQKKSNKPKPIPPQKPPQQQQQKNSHDGKEDEEDEDEDDDDDDDESDEVSK